jgi:hypothetical protein
VWVLVSIQEGVVQLRKCLRGFFIGSGEIMAVTKAAERAGKAATKRPTAKKTSKPKCTAEKQRIENLVAEAILGIERRFSDEKAPPTIGDYLKVMQLQKEFEEEAPKEIKITWVEPEKEATQEPGK